MYTLGHTLRKLVTGPSQDQLQLKVGLRLVCMHALCRTCMLPHHRSWEQHAALRQVRAMLPLCIATNVHQREHALCAWDAPECLSPCQLKQGCTQMRLWLCTHACMHAWPSDRSHAQTGSHVCLDTDRLRYACVCACVPHTCQVLCLVCSICSDARASLRGSTLSATRSCPLGRAPGPTARLRNAAPY